MAISSNNSWAIYQSNDIPLVNAETNHLGFLIGLGGGLTAAAILVIIYAVWLV